MKRETDKTIELQIKAFDRFLKKLVKEIKTYDNDDDHDKVFWEEIRSWFNNTDPYMPILDKDHRDDILFFGPKKWYLSDFLEKYAKTFEKYDITIERDIYLFRENDIMERYLDFSQFTERMVTNIIGEMNDQVLVTRDNMDEFEFDSEKEKKEFEKLMDENIDQETGMCIFNSSRFVAERVSPQKLVTDCGNYYILPVLKIWY